MKYIVISDEQGNILGTVWNQRGVENTVVSSIDIPEGKRLVRVDLNGEPKGIFEDMSLSTSEELKKMRDRLELNNKKLIALGNSVTELSDLLISSENGNGND